MTPSIIFGVLLFLQAVSLVGMVWSLSKCKSTYTILLDSLVATDWDKKQRTNTTKEH